MRKLAGLDQAADGRHKLLKDDPCLHPLPDFGHVDGVDEQIGVLRNLAGDVHAK